MTTDTSALNPGIIAAAVACYKTMNMNEPQRLRVNRQITDVVICKHQYGIAFYHEPDSVYLSTLASKIIGFISYPEITNSYTLRY